MCHIYSRSIKAPPRAPLRHLLLELLLHLDGGLGFIFIILFLFGVRGLVWGLMIWVWVLGFRFRVSGLGWGLEFRVWGFGFGVWGLGFGVWGLGSGV
jgi:hypothetical protein